MVSGGAGACRSRSRREAIAEPGELDLSGLAVDQDMRRLEVLVDEATLVRLAQGGGDAETEAQEASQLQGRAEQAVERLSAGILKHQRHTAAIMRKRDGSRRPVGVKFGLERIFVFESLDATGRGFFCGNKQDRRQAVARAPV